MRVEGSLLCVMVGVERGEGDWGGMMLLPVYTGSKVILTPHYEGERVMVQGSLLCMMVGVERGEGNWILLLVYAGSKVILILVLLTTGRGVRVQGSLLRMMVGFLVLTTCFEGKPSSEIKRVFTYTPLCS